MSLDVSPLFTPYQLGTLSLANRIVMAPMTRSASPAGVPGANVAAYYARRARGGVGLIITEGTYVGHPAANGYPAVPAFHGADALAGWGEVVRAVHADGGKIMPQLWHVGSVRRPGVEPDPSVGGFSPSGLAKAGGRVVGHPMTDSDIADVFSAFAKAAAHAEVLGFDGIELHGAHGYLLDQFLWEGLNQRDDAYGGSLAARTRFVAELVREVRKAVSASFPLCLRYSQWKLQDYQARLAHTPSELAALLDPLASAGVDIFHCSTRRFWQPEFEGSPLNLAGWTKQLTGKAVITVGSVGITTEFATEREDETSRLDRLASLSARLGAGEFDLVAIGRSLIGDPEWPNKVREGRFGELVGFDKQQLQQLA
jgi:2,4-dienoyl-CoA reductase-like NADH-dependent reductase (Old Yellow Enzyme family)